MEVNLKKIQFINYRQFKGENLDFDPRFTVLTGVNGSGKSSVLKAATIALSWLVARIRNESGQGQYLLQNAVTNGEVNGCIKAFFDESNPIVVPNKARAGLFKEYKFEIGMVKEMSNTIRQASQTDPNASIPIFAYYGVERAVIEIPLRIRSREYSKFDVYDSNCLAGGANFRSFFTWFRSWEDWENEQNARKETGSERVEFPGLRAFRAAMKVFMPEYDGIHVSRHPLGMMMRKKGEELNAEQLSDGEKIYLALIGDICRRLSIANPVGNPLEGNGIVLIDEIDLHLHPRWQSEIAERLTRTFPNIQFIVTTHSPHVINSVPTSSLRILSGDGHVQKSSYGFGLPTEIIFKDIMGMTRDVPENIDRLVKEFYESISKNEYTTAETQMHDLQKMVPEYPDLVRMRKILAHAKR